MAPPKKPASRSANKPLAGLLFGLCGLLSLLLCGQAMAQAGAVANLSGPLSAKKDDGSVRVLALNSTVHSGDTLYTEKDTYARVKFADGGEITLRPDSQFKIENFAHSAEKPDEGNAFFRLLKGGLRAVSGLIGKGSNQDRYRMSTSTATIGIRGTHFGLLFCQDDCAGIKTASGKTPENGLHVDVAEGAVVVSTQAGSAQVAAGQNALVRSANTLPQPVAPENSVKVQIIQSVMSDKSKPGGVGQNNDPECVVQ
jgi:hypothetical protein